MKIFISGGTGFVGEHVCRALRKQGHDLRLLAHRRRSVPESGMEYVTGNVTNMESFGAAVHGCDAVINLVGIIREFPLHNITFEQMHVRATATMLAACQQAGISRYLQMSALGTRPEAVSAYHKSKWQAEKLVRASGLEWTIFRPSLIFGPKDAFINMLAEQLRLTPVMPVIGSGTYRLQPIHADDVARCFTLALEMPETIRQCYELCGTDRLSYLELLDAVAAAMGRPAPFKPHAPLGLMKLIIPVMQRLPRFPITTDQLQMLLEENICDSKWQDTFRFTPRLFRDGISEYLHKT